jgi:hypothetical protein
MTDKRYKVTAASGFVGTDERYKDTVGSGFVGLQVQSTYEVPYRLVPITVSSCLWKVAALQCSSRIYLDADQTGGSPPCYWRV